MLLVILFILFLCLIFLRSYSGGKSRLINNPKELVTFFSIAKNIDMMNNIISTNFKSPAIKLGDLSDKIRYAEDYVEVRKIVKTSCHFGQLKLLLSEIQFLTIAMQSHLDQKTVVYAGSAPSNKLNLLLAAFPNVRFILVDPNEHIIFEKDPQKIIYNNMQPHGGPTHYTSPKLREQILYLQTNKKKEKLPKIINFMTAGGVKSADKSTFAENNTYLLADALKTSARVIIIEDFMTNQLAEDISRHVKNPLFLCDIRSSDEGEEFPTDADILINLAQQYCWIAIMRPEFYCIKFRHVWYQSAPEKIAALREMMIFEAAKKFGIDFVSDYLTRQFKYLAGDIYLQAFPGVSSTETRLIGSAANLAYSNHGTPTAYEAKFVHLNIFLRQFAFHAKNQTNQEFGIDHCQDCALMYHIFNEYEQKFGAKINVADIFHTLRKNLNIDLHGQFATPYKSIDDVKNRQIEFIAKNIYNAVRGDLVTWMK